MSTSSYLGSRLFPTGATLEGSNGDSGIVLLSDSSSWMDVLASGMIESEWDLAKAFFNSWSSTTQ
jgi:hypothetical protein